MPTLSAPSTSCLKLSPTMTASAGVTSSSCSAALKMLGCGFIRPWSDEDTVALMSPSQLEVRLKRSQAAVRVRDQADAHAGTRQLPHHRRHVVVHLEVLIGGPLAVDLARALVDARAAAAHHLDDRARVGDEDLRRRRRIVRAIEQRGRAGHRGVEPRGVDGHAVARAESLIAFAAKGRSGVDQREVDVEEDGLQSRSS